MCVSTTVCVLVWECVCAGVGVRAGCVGAKGLRATAHNKPRRGEWLKVRQTTSVAIVVAAVIRPVMSNLFILLFTIIYTYNI